MWKHGLIDVVILVAATVAAIVILARGPDLWTDGYPPPPPAVDSSPQN